MRKYFLLAIIGGLFLFSSAIVLADTYVTNRFLDINLYPPGIFNKELYSFYGTDNQNDAYTCVGGYKYDSNYVCGMFLTQYINPVTHLFDIEWIKPNTVIRQTGSSLGSDISGNNFDCSGSTSSCGTACGSTLALSSSTSSTVLGSAYSTGWTDGCGFGTCDLSKSQTEYRPAYDILCNKESDGTGKWYRC